MKPATSAKIAENFILNVVMCSGDFWRGYMIEIYRRDALGQIDKYIEESGATKSVTVAIGACALNVEREGTCVTTLFSNEPWM